jgi:hypothetical protein
MKKYDQFVVEVLGKHGYEAVKHAAAQMPEIESLVPAQAILSWVDIASRIEYSGNVPSTDRHVAFTKNENGYTITVDGNSAEATHIRQLASVIADIVGFSPDSAPELRKGQMNDLIRTIDVLTKFELAKANRSFSQKGAHGGFGGPTAPMSHTPTEKVKPPSIPIPKMGSSLAGEAKGTGAIKAGGTKPAPMKPVDQTSTNVGKTKLSVDVKAKPMKIPQAKSAGGAKPAAKSEPKVFAVSLAKSSNGCPRCGTYSFSDDKFVGCRCYGDLAKSTYSKRIDGGHVVFFNYQWAPETIQAFISDYED